LGHVICLFATLVPVWNNFRNFLPRALEPRASIGLAISLVGTANDGRESPMSAATAVSRIQVEHAQLPPAPPATVRRIADQIRNQGSACIRIHARNMFPFLRPGDQVFIRKWDFAQISVGDTILFERGSRLHIQRVLRRSLMRSENRRVSFLVTKCDTLDTEDLPVSAQEFLGRATRIHRRNRHIDLDSVGQMLLGRVIAGISRWSRVVYGPLRYMRSSILSKSVRARSEIESNVD
jgi:hypothetical protein